MKKWIVEIRKSMMGKQICSDERMIFISIDEEEAQVADAIMLWT